MGFFATPLAGGLASGAFNLLGGLLGQSGQSAANSANLQFAYQQLQQQQEQFNAQMGFQQQQLGDQNQLAWANADLATQMFDSPVRQRVYDAQQAGISPLVALGMQPSSPPSAQIGVSPPSPTISGSGPGSMNAMAPMTQAMGNFGQDISRAMMATKTPEDRALVAAQTTGLIKDNDVKDAHITALNAAANADNARAAYYSKPIPSVSGRSGNPDLGPAPKQSYADEAYKTSANTMEYQAAPGTAASQSFLEGTLATARNRLGGLLPGDRGAPSPGRVMDDMRKLFPGAVGYKIVGAGNYAPVYPEDQVKEDVSREGGGGWADRAVGGALDWIHRNFAR